jgi:K+-transporting ATPase A subunit
MTVIFTIALIFFYWAETQGNSALTALGVDPALGNMEGKDLRFGQAGAALFVDATTGAAIAGSLAAKKKAKPSAGTVPTNDATFVVFLLGVIAVITALQYLPALTLGPIAEQVLGAHGATF